MSRGVSPAARRHVAEVRVASSWHNVATASFEEDAHSAGLDSL